MFLATCYVHWDDMILLDVEKFSMPVDAEFLSMLIKNCHLSIQIDIDLLITDNFW